MGSKSNGLGAGKKLKKRRKRGRMLDPYYVTRTFGLKKRSDPLKGSHKAKAIVLEKKELEAKQPN